MAVPLAVVRAAGPGTTSVLATGNYLINTMFLQLELITALGAGLVQLGIVVRSSVTHVNLFSIFYSYNATAAGSTNFNQTFPFPSMNAFMPRGEGVEIVLTNGANVSAVAVDVILYGASLS